MKCQKINIPTSLDNEANEVEDENMIGIRGLEENYAENENSTIIENEFLKSYNLYINEKYKLLICKSCKYVVEKENSFSHISNNHRKLVDSKLLKKEMKEAFIDQLNNLDPLLNLNLNIEIAEVIEGLRVFEGFKCGHGGCNYLCRNMNTMYSHTKKEHENLKMEFEECLLQTLFLNPEKRKYFRVKKSSNNMNQGREVEEGENIEIFGITRTSNSSRAGHQFVSSFFTEANWATIVDKFTREELKELRGVEVPPGLKASVDSVFAIGENFSRGTNHYFSELIENPFSK